MLMRKDEARPGAEFTFSKFFDNWAVGTGIGIRYDLSFLILRLDWGIALHVPYETGKRGYYNIPNFKDEWASISHRISILTEANGFCRQKYAQFWLSLPFQ